MKIAKFLVIALMSICLASCGSVNSSTSSMSPESSSNKDNEFDQIDQQEFELALGKLQVTKDEFDGNYNISPKFDEPIFTTVGKSRIALNASVAKTAEDSDWGFALSTAYFGKGWMFHDEVNVKSDDGILNLKDVLEARRQVQDGGNVLEVGLRPLELGEIQQFCEIIKSNEIKFRLRGLSGEVTELTGTMDVQSANINRAICIVYAGIYQGLKP